MLSRVVTLPQLLSNGRDPLPRLRSATTVLSEYHQSSSKLASVKKEHIRIGWLYFALRNYIKLCLNNFYFKLLEDQVRVLARVWDAAQPLGLQAGPGVISEVKDHHWYFLLQLYSLFVCPSAFHNAGMRHALLRMNIDSNNENERFHAEIVNRRNFRR